MLPLLFSELGPVAAIVGKSKSMITKKNRERAGIIFKFLFSGGILGQEVIKVISNKDAPHNNFFLFNPLESAGVVECIGY